MDLAGLLGLLLMTLLAVGLGLLALRMRVGWWVLVGMAAVMALTALLPAFRGTSAASVLPALVYVAMLVATALLGQRAWAAVEASGRRVAPLELDRPTTTRLAAAGAVVPLALVGLNMWRPSGGSVRLVDAVVAGALQALVLVGLLALAARWRGGFLLVLVAQALTLLQLVLAAASLSGYFTASGMVGWLTGPILQVLALTAVSAWGWREWTTRERRRVAGASPYGPDAVVR